MGPLQNCTVVFKPSLLHPTSGPGLVATYIFHCVKRRHYALFESRTSHTRQKRAIVVFAALLA